MTGDSVRRTFLDFFREKGHTVIPSSSLIPHGDPTLLLTSAGMVQIKPYFMGEATPPSQRLASCQKCFRTTDIDQVGNQRSLTFFEMLGNFSVGDYFKREAIAFAWELVTERYKLPKERIWVSVYPTDDEALALWKEIAGLPDGRIVRLEDNWWGPVGNTGPCGPDSEMYYDRGEAVGCGRPDCRPGCDCERFLEFWNLVFMQFFKDEAGTLTPLPKKNIDTGLGLERMTMLLQGVDSVYDTDLFQTIIRRTEELTGSHYGLDAKKDYSLRVIADHSRAITFLIADGVLPSNEGRGYILRRVLRRAVRHGRLLGFTHPFLSETVQVVISHMADVYPELVQRRDAILRVVELEESKFHQTLSLGLRAVDELIEEAKREGWSELPGEAVFRLHDTYGFPRDLTAELAREQGLGIDQAGFEIAMQRQREMARASARFGPSSSEKAETYRELAARGESRFEGYERLELATDVVGIILEGNLVDVAYEGQEVEIILRETPFYPEGGGQVGDRGWIVHENGSAEVLDTQRPWQGLISHIARITRGSVQTGDTVEARVDRERRMATARHHTATHLLQRALRDVLGTHVAQAGSLVAPERLRFDFSHFAPLTQDQLIAVERQVNANVRANLRVAATTTTYEEATRAGAMALFGEKYGEQVRMVVVEECSRELCGGTHVSATGEIGYFVIVGEASVGAGLRRIEALAGEAAESFVRERLLVLRQLESTLQSADLQAKVTALLADLQSARREIVQLQRECTASEVENLLNRAVEVDGVRVLAAKVKAPNVEAMRDLGDRLRSRLGPSVVVLGTVMGGRPSFVAMVSPDLNLHAGQLVREVASVVGGGGGGRPDVAQAGGRDASKIDEALAMVEKIVQARRRSAK